MAVLSFNAGDALLTLTVDAGIYLCDFTKIEGPKPSSSGKSVSYIGTLRIVQDGKYKGKEFDLMFNTGTKSASLLGTMNFFPAASFLEVDAAIKGKKVEAVDQNIDTDTLVGKAFAASIGVATVEGKLVNTVNGFLPAGAEKNGPTF
jgi:hypothetical protein